MPTATIINPHPKCYNATKRAVSNLPGWQIKGAHKTGKAALGCLAAECPELIILDIDLPDINGLHCLTRLRKRCPEAHIIVFTKIIDDPSVLLAVTQGANSYVLKEDGISGLLRAIRLAERGYTYLSPHVATRLIGYYPPAVIHLGGLADLTSRQLEIVRLVVSGLSNKEVAKQINITDGGVRQHLHRIFTTLRIKSRAELIVRYTSFRN